MREYLKALKVACNWWKIKQGRATEYIRRLEEFDKAKILSQEHILAYYESFEIVELFRLWKRHIHEFPGLEGKIRKACEKGPFLGDGERPNASSNRPRNDAFCYLVAGKFLASGIPVLNVDGIFSCRFDECEANSDFTFTWQEQTIAVECKRLQSERQLLKRANQARDQIIRSGRCGVIAIDCSVLRRPAGTVLENSSPTQAEFQLSEWLRTQIEPKVRSSLSCQILGMLLFSRIPAMTTLDLVDNRGNPIYRRDCISSWLAVGSRDCSHWNILRNVASMFRKQKGLLDDCSERGIDVLCSRKSLERTS